MNHQSVIRRNEVKKLRNHGELTQPLKKQRKPGRRAAGCTRVLPIAFLLIICIFLGILIFAVIEIPSMASREFGPPNPGLTMVQRLMYSVQLIANSKSLNQPLEPGAPPREFAITLGESVNSISYRLEAEGMIADADSFRIFLIYAGLDTGVQAGEYSLSPGMTSIDIAYALQDPLPGAVEFNILAGWRVEEIAESLPTSGINVSPVDFITLVQDPPKGLLPEGIRQLDSLQGFLMPGVYQVERDISSYDLIKLFVSRFNESITPEIRTKFLSQGLDLYEAVILASIVEKEAVVDDEKPVIASVFLNRLANGMKLDSDPTVQYAHGFNREKGTWWKNPLTSNDLKIDSRYNTYIYTGLPPGPIANPGLRALLAVAEPETTGYFYFRALCDGSGRHSFAVTYQEHLNNACP